MSLIDTIADAGEGRRGRVEVVEFQVEPRFPRSSYGLRRPPANIGGRGAAKRFQDLGRMSVRVKELAKQQDEIGFRNFMEGRLSKLFCELQSLHLEDAEGPLNGRDWVKGLISKVLQITHSQWLYRNITFHDKQGGCTGDRRWSK